jgi:hypothetical protein
VTETVVHLVVYGDFNCPFSALASARTSELERRGLAQVEWRAVEHDTSIPERGLDVDGSRADGFRDELDQIRGLLVDGEPDRLRVPRRQVNTRLATERFAGTPAAARPSTRQELFAAHWERGDDIGDPEVLDRLGEGPADASLAAQWREGWLAATTSGKGSGPIVPALVLPDGYVSRGLGALARLAGFLEPGEPDACG